MTNYAATVLDVTDEGPTVRVPMLGGTQSWGPLASSVPDLAVDDRVIVAPLGESTDRLHILARLQSRQTEQGEIPGLVDRLAAIEALDVTQNGRLDGLVAQDVSLGNSLNGLAGRVTATETKNGQQDGRLSAIETLDATQDSRLTATEAKANAAATASALAAVDAGALHRTGAETKSGVLTLSDQPVIPAATAATSPVRNDDPKITKPSALVRLTATGNITYNTTMGDLYAQTNWTAIDDPLGMFRMTGGYASLVPGIAGWWWIDYRTLWINSTNASDAIIAFVVKNTRSAGSSIARDSRRYVGSGSDGSPVQAIKRVKLAATDTLFWGNWSAVNSALVPGVPALNSYTEIEVSYDGPG